MRGLVQKNRVVNTKELFNKGMLNHQSILVHRSRMLVHKEGLSLRDRLVHLSIMVHKKWLYLRDKLVNLSIMDHRKGLLHRERLVHLSTMVHRRGLHLRGRLVHLSRLNTMWSLSNHFHLKNDTVVLKQKMLMFTF